MILIINETENIVYDTDKMPYEQSEQTIGYIENLKNTQELILEDWEVNTEFEEMKRPNLHIWQNEVIRYTEKPIYLYPISNQAFLTTIDIHYKMELI